MYGGCTCSGSAAQWRALRPTLSPKKVSLLKPPTSQAIFGAYTGLCCGRGLRFSDTAPIFLDKYMNRVPHESCRTWISCKVLPAIRVVPKLCSKLFSASRALCHHFATVYPLTTQIYSLALHY